jgi:lipopolysaccharide/colanic/teichoic acid biosynthesis glycosyltransferase
VKWVPGGQVLGKVLASTALDVADEEGPSRLVMVTKRASDIVVAAAGILFAFPLLLALAVAVKQSSQGPVFYRGVRAGIGGRAFRIFKFRSMVQNAERLGGPSTSGDDPRLTAVGRLMRRYKVDELPQLINVFLGEMSLVGPRPEVLSEVELYAEAQRKVLLLRPGITDWASIWNSNEEAILSGAADPHQAYKELIQPTKLKLQLEYYRTCSFAVDARILTSTFIKLFRRDWTPEALKEYPKLRPL